MSIPNLLASVQAECKWQVIKLLLERISLNIFSHHATGEEGQEGFGQVRQQGQEEVCRALPPQKMEATIVSETEARKSPFSPDEASLLLRLLLPGSEVGIKTILDSVSFEKSRVRGPWLSVRTNLSWKWKFFSELLISIINRRFLPLIDYEPNACSVM